MKDNAIRSDRSDGRFQTLGGLVHHRYKQLQPKMQFDPGLTGDEFADWKRQVRRRLRQLLAMPNPVGQQPEPKMIDEQPRDGYRLQKWELYPEEDSVVPMLMMVPDDVTETEPAAAVLCLPGSNHPLERLAGEPEPEGSPENRFPEHNCMGFHFVKEGLIALCMENPGTGSMAEPDVADWRRQAWDLVWLGRNYEGVSVAHKVSAYRWLREHPVVDPERIAACGFSLGGKPALLLGVLEPTVRAVVWNSLAYDHRVQAIKTNLGRIAPWQYVPGFLQWFDYLDIMAALAPTPLCLPESGRTEELQKVRDAFALNGADENLEISYVPSYRAPAHRKLDNEPIPEGLTKEEYRAYMNTTVDEHRFQYDEVVPWVVQQLAGTGTDETRAAEKAKVESDGTSDATPATRDTLTADMHALGIEEGDTLFIHASYKSLGAVEGGAGTVVAAFEDALGPDGLIMMPSFNLGEGDKEDRAARWDHATTPSTVGWLTEFFRRMDGTVRSDHYSHSVAARGRDAHWIVSAHRENTGLFSPWDREPWGKTYGDQSPMLRAYRRENSKLLMLGVGYDSSTYQHVVEVVDWHLRRKEDPKAPFFTYKPREKLGQFWEEQGRFRRGKIGQANCRLFSIRDYVDTLLAEVQHDPAKYCPWHPDNKK
ncbi:MAG: alpha/beta hydrolase family protein [Candidatus Brocadiia bacterium]